MEQNNEVAAPEVARQRKPRKVSDVRHLPGANVIRKKIAEVMKVHANIQQHSEVVEKVAEALGITKQEAFEKLKNPEGIYDVAKLAAYIRGATLRNDLALDSVKLCRIAQVVAENIGEANLLIPRENVKVTTENDGK